MEWICEDEVDLNVECIWKRQPSHKSYMPMDIAFESLLLDLIQDPAYL